jgi:hypothetical protein
MAKCRYCHEGNNMPFGKIFHRDCETLWKAEHIPKNQKRHLSQCPVCNQKFYFWQKASVHALLIGHNGDYTT